MGEIDGAFRSRGLPRVGTVAVSMVIAAAATEAGAVLRTSSPVNNGSIGTGRTTEERSAGWRSE
jgi:hypothetical protein